ncbi:MAG: endonuclease/exonuclease/phosphatase family protein [Candidatus Riflebacteria bacterium]
MKPFLALFFSIALLAASAQAEEIKIKAPNRSFFRKFDQLFERFRQTSFGRAFNRYFFKTGLYHAFWWRRPPEVFNRCTSGPDDQKIRIVTANLMLFPPPMGEQQEERIRVFAETIRPLNPDLILLQEIWDNNSLIIIADVFRDYNLAFSPASLYNRSGLVTLSRNEFSKIDFIMFPLDIRHNPEELLAQKGALTTMIKRGTREIRVINSHLYSASADQDYRPNPGQLAFLKNMVDFSSNQPTILAGDLNLKPVEVNEYAGKIFRSDPDRLPTAGSPKRKWKLDHILLYPRPGSAIFSRRVESPVVFSDHSPLYGIANFK